MVKRVSARFYEMDSDNPQDEGDVVNRSVPSITTAIGKRLSSKNEPYDMHDVLLVRYYLHMAGGSSNRGGGGHPTNPALRSTPDELNDTRNTPELEKKIKVFQQMGPNIATDGRVSVPPGNSFAFLGSASAAGVKQGNGYIDNGRATTFTMVLLVEYWGMRSNQAKLPMVVSQQRDCPDELRAPLRRLGL